MLRELCLSNIVTKKKKKATEIHGQWPFQNITKTFVMHIDSLPPSSLFNPLECLWEKQQLCLYILLCKTEPSQYMAFLSLVFIEKFQMLETHDSLEQIPSLSQHVWTLAFRIESHQELWCLILSVGLYLYLSVTNGNYVDMMKLFGMKIQNLVKT